MSRFIDKSHNVSVLLYHFVCPTKYRRSVIDAKVDAALVEICEGIAQRYEIEFLEIGADRNHVHYAKISDFTRLDPVCPYVQPDEDHNRREKHNSEGVVRADASPQEILMGECLLVERVLCAHGGQAWQ